MIWATSSIAMLSLIALISPTALCETTTPAPLNRRGYPFPPNEYCNYVYTNYFGRGRIANVKDFTYRVTLSIPIKPTGLSAEECNERLRRDFQIGCSAPFGERTASVELFENGAPKVKEGKCVFTIIMRGTHWLVNPTADRGSPPNFANTILRCKAAEWDLPFPFPEYCIGKRTPFLSPI